jgi:hypothetical protein
MSSKLPSGSYWSTLKITKLRASVLFLVTLLLTTGIIIRSSSEKQVWVDLSPVLVEMKVPAGIAERITVEDQPMEAVKSGSLAMVTLSYQPSKGEKVWFMTAYYFVEKELDKSILPDQVPPYGFKLMAQDGMAISVIGPQESAFEVNSEDGENYTMLYDILYDADSYRFTNRSS